MQSDRVESGIILDCHYLAHKYAHVFPDLEHEGQATGSIYGFLIAISELRMRLGSHFKWFGFAFEGGKLKRAERFPIYKKPRTEKLTDEEWADRKKTMDQIRILREELLDDMGFANIWSQDGEEADDIMAKVAEVFSHDARHLGKDLLLMTSDHDLYQCLSPRVSILKKSSDHKTYTSHDFHEEYGIAIDKWHIAKAIAGEGPTGDNVPGIKGIGVPTAIKYLTDQLKEKSVAYKKLQDPENRKIVARNMDLMKLPSKTATMPEIVYVEDHGRIAEGFARACKRFGIKNLEYGE